MSRRLRRFRRDVGRRFIGAVRQVRARISRAFGRRNSRVRDEALSPLMDSDSSVRETVAGGVREDNSGSVNDVSQRQDSVRLFEHRLNLFGNNLANAYSGFVNAFNKYDKSDELTPVFRGFTELCASYQQLMYHFMISGVSLEQNLEHFRYQMKSIILRYVEIAKAAKTIINKYEQDYTLIPDCYERNRLAELTNEISKSGDISARFESDVLEYFSSTKCTYDTEKSYEIFYFLLEIDKMTPGKFFSTNEHEIVSELLDRIVESNFFDILMIEMSSSKIFDDVYQSLEERGELELVLSMVEEYIEDIQGQDIDDYPDYKEALKRNRNRIPQIYPDLDESSFEENRIYELLKFIQEHRLKKDDKEFLSKIPPRLRSRSAYRDHHQKQGSAAMSGIREIQRREDEEMRDEMSLWMNSRKETIPDFDLELEMLEVERMLEELEALSQESESEIEGREASLSEIKNQRDRVEEPVVSVGRLVDLPFPNLDKELKLPERSKPEQTTELESEAEGEGLKKKTFTVDDLPDVPKNKVGEFTLNDLPSVPKTGFDTQVRVRSAKRASVKRTGVLLSNK